eukprot:GILI01012109.1.p1 GENE.GILI01012109.1~~GILI01012109.1.p1  ORF type:complete len:506 (-),score=57.96 GILI01012109.1:36-1553(-)
MGKVFFLLLALCLVGFAASSSIRTAGCFDWLRGGFRDSSQLTKCADKSFFKGFTLIHMPDDMKVFQISTRYFPGEGVIDPSHPMLLTLPQKWKGALLQYRVNDARVINLEDQSTVARLAPYFRENPMRLSSNLLETMAEDRTFNLDLDGLADMEEVKGTKVLYYVLGYNAKGGKVKGIATRVHPEAMNLLRTSICSILDLILGSDRSRENEPRKILGAIIPPAPAFTMGLGEGMFFPCVPAPAQLQSADPPSECPHRALLWRGEGDEADLFRCVKHIPMEGIKAYKLPQYLRMYHAGSKLPAGVVAGQDKGYGYFGSFMTAEQYRKMKSGHTHEYYLKTPINVVDWTEPSVLRYFHKLLIDHRIERYSEVSDVIRQLKQKEAMTGVRYKPTLMADLMQRSIEPFWTGVLHAVFNFDPDLPDHSQDIKRFSWGTLDNVIVSSICRVIQLANLPFNGIYGPPSFSTTHQDVADGFLLMHSEMAICEPGRYLGSVPNLQPHQLVLERH